MNEAEMQIVELVKDLTTLTDKFAKLLNDHNDKMTMAAITAIRRHGVDINLIRCRMIDEFPFTR